MTSCFSSEKEGGVEVGRRATRATMEAELCGSERRKASLVWRLILFRSTALGDTFLPTAMAISVCGRMEGMKRTKKCLPFQTEPFLSSKVMRRGLPIRSFLLSMA